jgi:IS30 family transposase
MRRMLSSADREEISRGVAAGLAFSSIADRLGRDPSVVCREVARHGGRGCYRGRAAHRSAALARARPKTFALDRNPRLRAYVRGQLVTGWSPASISGRLPIEYPRRHAWRVSHEAIYQWIYAQPVGVLKDALIELRTGRTRRRPHGSGLSRAPRIKDPTWIDDRPPEAADRAIPGHWEGDLVVGKNNMTAVATLVERRSRYLMLAPLSGRDALTVGQAILTAYGPIPASLRKTLTWDCGSEMACHPLIATRIPVYFAHPHSPWERPTSEHTNRILREYLPRGSVITHDPDTLAAIAAEINDRPRKILGWAKPSEVFADVLLNPNASTT